MNTEFSDWLIHLKPKAMRESKGKQHPQNEESKEQPIDLDPSKAWIKNKGAGTTTQLPRFKTKRDNVLVTATTMSSSLPASTSSPPPAMTPTNTRNNKSATASHVSNDKHSQDKWMALLQQISDTSIDESADSSEQTLVNASCDTDGSNYETCIEIDETLVGASAAEATDVKPTKPAPTQSKAMDITTNQRFKNFPLELTNADLHDEISLYEGMGTIDWMSSRVTDPEMLAQELSTLKHEQSEHLDDTLISEMVPNGLDDSIRPSRIHELSIPLGPFDFPSTSSLSATALSLPPSNLSSREIKSESILQSQQLDSTSISATNFAEIDEKKSILREKIWNESKARSNANILDAHTPFKLPSYEQFKSDKKCRTKSHTESQLSNMSWSLMAQASNQVPNTPSLSNGAFVHPVYMRDEDVNRLIQSGHIFFTDGRLHYKHKALAPRKIF